MHGDHPCGISADSLNPDLMGRSSLTRENLTKKGGTAPCSAKLIENLRITVLTS
ncbi:hypothetical protein F385_3730 [Pantoea agglomerans 299R]|nr:hypothetical protein F385_3730 [Pantoea agglomerans 299R]